uniref:Telomere length regulation protein elg1 n=1 Tax=Talaromyces marneffei PM1 TaxID=1077442 RepID=A0A093VMS9_TALMA
MSSTVANRVMDHGEQQKVHPFFGSFLKKSTTPDQASLPPAHETTTDQLAASRQVPYLNSQQIQNGPNTQDNTLEEDPNIERRKRVKTSTPEAAPGSVEAEPTRTETSTHPANEGSSKLNPPKKLLKLNINGKLLSSPPAQKLENVASKGVRDRRRSNRKGKDTKRVVIKYDNKLIVGQKIDDIINGKERYAAPQKSVEQVSTTTRKDTKPLKATHPFFLSKKPEFKASSETLQLANDSLTQQDSTKHDSNIQFSAKRTFSRSLFSKHPELAPPIWPPRDLVHVRGAVNQLCDQFEDISLHQKKSKQRAVHIDDTENILLYESKKARNEMQFQMSESKEPFLRVPLRTTISGQTLRKSMKSKVLHGIESGSKYGSGYQGEEGRAHPCIAKLYASIATSTTSFDNGVCDTVQWTQKYMPKCAEDVLQPGPEARMLRDWLKELMVSSVGTGKIPTHKSKKKLGGHKSKRRKMADKLDGFIVSNSEEDELAGGVTVSSKRTVIRVGDSIGKFKKGEKGRLTNAVLMSGPNGCGKSASIYAVAKELDFEVFEINSGTRRSAKDILERVGDMTQNHLVQLDGKEDESDANIHPTGPGLPDAKQNTVNMFFKAAAQNKAKDNRSKSKGNINEGFTPEAPNTPSRSQKQSLILLEEVDVLFEEDKQFWTGILALIEQSKRPVIMTCTNESLVPLQDLSLHAILRYRAPPPSLAIDYLLLVAANEGHMLSREAVSTLYSASQQDLRKSIMQLDFWCQMAVGSQKSGIDWILDRWPAGSDVDAHGNKLKVISLHTYQCCMGWFNRDMSLVDKSLIKDSELLLEGLNWWQLDFDTDNEDGWWSHYLSRPAEDHRRIDSLQDVMTMAENHSAFDVLSRHWSLDPNKDDLDTTIFNISGKEKTNYQEDYPLLVANRKPDYTGLSSDIGSTAYALMRRIAVGTNMLQDDSLTNGRVLAKQSETKSMPFSCMAYCNAFEPIMRGPDLVPQGAGRVAPSFGNGVSVIAADIAPYIRSIMAYDLHLERYRDELNGLSSQGPTKRKARTTRASRAALEGGSKSHTRRERWFPTDANAKRILATGSKVWEDALAQTGHVVVFPALSSTDNTHTDSEGSQSMDVE